MLSKIGDRQLTHSRGWLCGGYFCMQRSVYLLNGGYSHEYAKSTPKETADSTEEKKAEEQQDGILFQLPLHLPQLWIRL
jgi:hypothetical protein